MRTVATPSRCSSLAVLVVIGVGSGYWQRRLARPHHGHTRLRDFSAKSVVRPLGVDRTDSTSEFAGRDTYDLTGTIRFVSTSSPGTVYYTHGDDGRWTARLPPGTYNVSGRS